MVVVVVVIMFWLLLCYVRLRACMPRELSGDNGLYVWCALVVPAFAYLLRDGVGSERGLYLFLFLFLLGGFLTQACWMFGIVHSARVWLCRVGGRCRVIENGVRYVLRAVLRFVSWRHDTHTRETRNCVLCVFVERKSLAACLLVAQPCCVAFRCIALRCVPVRLGSVRFFAWFGFDFAAQGGPPAVHPVHRGAGGRARFSGAGVLLLQGRHGRSLHRARRHHQGESAGYPQ